MIQFESSITEVEGQLGGQLGDDGLSFSHLEIFYFGVFYTTEEDKRVISFENLLRKILENIEIGEDIQIRVSIIDFGPLKQTVQGFGKRIDKKEVKLQYQNRRQIITSFNNQLDIFYEKSQKDLIGDEVVHYFHTELLDCDELKLYQANYSRAFEILLKKKKRKYLNEIHYHIEWTEGQHRALAESEKWNSRRIPDEQRRSRTATTTVA